MQEKLRGTAWYNYRVIQVVGMFDKKEDAKLGIAQTRVQTQSWRATNIVVFELNCKTKYSCFVLPSKVTRGIQQAENYAASVEEDSG